MFSNRMQNPFIFVITLSCYTTWNCATLITSFALLIFIASIGLLSPSLPSSSAFKSCLSRFINGTDIIEISSSVLACSITSHAAISAASCHSFIVANATCSAYLRRTQTIPVFVRHADDAGRIVRTYCCVVKAIADTRQTITTHRNEQLCFQPLCMYAVRGTAKDSKGRNDGGGRIGEPALGPRNGFECRQNSRNINCLLLCELFEIPPSVRLSVCLSVRSSIHPSIRLFVPCCHYYPHCIKLTQPRSGILPILLVGPGSLLLLSPMTQQ